MKFANLTRAALLVSAVALLPATTAGLAAVDSRSGPQFGKLVAIYQLIKANYVDQVEDDKLLKGAIQGMLTSLDPHSSYLDGASLQRLETMIDGNYSGLGLSVVYGIVKGHGGRIDLDTAPGQGCRFTIWLPLKPHAAKEEEEVR